MIVLVFADGVCGDSSPRRRRVLGVVQHASRFASKALPIVMGGLIVLAAMAATGALGANHDTVYYGCLASSNGSLYKVSTEPDPECRPHDEAISWSHTGPQGEAGVDGDDGQDGAPGISNLTRVVVGPVATAAGAGNVATATCPSGLVPVSGGHRITGAGQSGGIVTRSDAVAGDANNPFGFEEFVPLSDDRYVWQVAVYNSSGSSLSFYAIALCSEVEVDE